LGEHGRRVLALASGLPKVFLQDELLRSQVIPAGFEILDHDSVDDQVMLHDSP